MLEERAKEVDIRDSQSVNAIFISKGDIVSIIIAVILIVSVFYICLFKYVGQLILDVDYRNVVIILVLAFATGLVSSFINYKFRVFFIDYFEKGKHQITKVTLITSFIAIMILLIFFTAGFSSGIKKESNNQMNMIMNEIIETKKAIKELNENIYVYNNVYDNKPMVLLEAEGPDIEEAH